MSRLYARISGLKQNDDGATAIEYGLIATLVSIAIIAALTAVGGKLTAAFTAIQSAL